MTEWAQFVSKSTLSSLKIGKTNLCMLRLSHYINVKQYTTKASISHLYQLYIVNDFSPSVKSELRSSVH